MRVAKPTHPHTQVKLGIDTETAKHYAIKIIDKEQLQREHMEEQLKREIAVMKLLDHENVVKLFEVLQTQRHIYLVLELVTGGELFDRIVAAKRFDEKTARNFFQQLILGLYYCHTQQVAHRDLKPENLLLDGRVCCWHIVVVRGAVHASRTRTREPYRTT